MTAGWCTVFYESFYFCTAPPPRLHSEGISAIFTAGLRALDAGCVGVVVTVVVVHGHLTCHQQSPLLFWCGWRGLSAPKVTQLAAPMGC